MQAKKDNSLVVIEATSAQSNQDGGYTGKTPRMIADEVLGMADSMGFPRDLVVLGGDHLGPNPYSKLPASEAMPKALEMVRQYVAAGFRKIHLDASMHVGDDDRQMPLHKWELVVAERAAQMC